MEKTKILSLLTGLTVLFAARENNENEDSEGPEPREQVGRTVLVYIVGDSGVSELSSLFKVNFSDMKADMEEADYSKCNLVAYSEMINDVPHLISSKWKNGKVVADTPFAYDEQSPLDREVMASVISQAVSYFPADSHGFVFLFHSSSWVSVSNNANSHSIEYYRGTQMNMLDFHETLPSALPKPSKFVLFGSCNIQSVEVTYKLRNCAEYFIDSPAEIPGPGIPYKALVPEMLTETSLVTNIVEAYYGYYERSYTGVAPVSDENWTGEVTASMIKSATLDNLAAAIETVIPRYVQEKGEVDHSNILAYDFNDDANYDFEELIQNSTGGVDNTDYRSWYTAFEATVVYRKATLRNYSGIIHRMFAMEGPGGLSIYIPTGASNSTMNTFYRTLSWYTTVGWDGTEW